MTEPLPGLKTAQQQELADLAGLLDCAIVSRWRVAVDGGAHIGGWTVALAQRFEHVIAFEPAPDTRAILEQNVASLANVEVRPEALMMNAGPVEMIFPRKSRALTSRRAEPTPEGSCRAITLDSLKLPKLDFLKLDLEGAEPLALVGAMLTLQRCKPFVVIEEVGLGRAYGFPFGAASMILESCGYRPVWSAGPNLGYAR